MSEAVRNVTTSRKNLPPKPRNPLTLEARARVMGMQDRPAPLKLVSAREEARRSDVELVAGLRAGQIAPDLAGVPLPDLAPGPGEV